MNTSHLLSEIFFASTAITIVELPYFSAACFTNSLFKTAEVLIETLSAPACNSFFISSKFRTPPPTVSGMKQFSAVFLTVFNSVCLLSLDAVISKKHSSSAPSEL